MMQLIVLVVATQRQAALDANLPAMDAPMACQLILTLLGIRVTLRTVRRLADRAGTPFRRAGSASVGLDLLVATFGATCGWNYGVRFVYAALRAAHPHRRISFHAVKEAWRRLNMAAYNARFTGAVRRLIRQGHFYAPHFGALWCARAMRSERVRRACSG